MDRRTIDNGSWFDVDKATIYEESCYHDGQNFISCATGSQWDHEALYVTAGGAYVLRQWSQWQGSRYSWTQIDESEALAWLRKNGHKEGFDKETEI